MVSKTFTAALLALSTSASASKLLGGKVRCAGEPSESHIAQARELYEVERSALRANAKSFKAPINVDTYFHVISAAESSYITEQQLQDQLKLLNDAYNPHQVTFNLIDTTFTVNSDWAAGNDELGMKRDLKQGDYSTLNIYYVDTPKLQGRTALGYCHFPEPNVTEGSETWILDGCVVEAETVPGGSTVPYDLGGTAVHEVGHWFDLYHTFQGGCDGGDLVDDTPPMSTPTSGCPAGKDTCPAEGLDPIHNWMDYSDDICLEEFTAGQEVRMHSAWENYRQ